MFRQIFANRYAALIWVALTLFSAAAFVGDGGGKDQLNAVASNYASQQEELAAPSDGHTFAEDEELVEDPAPSLEPDVENPQILNGPNGERYRVLTPEEAARVNGQEATAQ